MKNIIKCFVIIAFVAVIGFIFASCLSFGDGSSSSKGGKVRVEMLNMKGGIFTMGSPENERYRLPNSDETQHRVTVSDFSMGKYPITQRQYETVMGVNPSTFPNLSTPVNGVSWFDAVEFCNKLSEMEGLTPVYTISGRTPETGHPITAATVTANWDADGYRLPTEAQWEYAARAGSRTAYWSGAEMTTGKEGWYSGNSGNRTHPVGEKDANRWGLYDMYGNVQEWCWDWYGAYGSGAQTDPKGPASGEKRVTRGGYYESSNQHLRSAFRWPIAPFDSETINHSGFRVVAPAREEEPSFSFFSISLPFVLAHDSNNVRAAQKSVMFWFNGDTRTSVTVPWGQTLEIPVNFEYGQQNTRVDAEFEDGTGYAFKVITDTIDPSKPAQIRYRNSGGQPELIFQQ